MSLRVNMPIIGTDIARTESLVISGASQNLATGEIFVADKYKKPLADAGSPTIATTDTIYIGMGLAETITYTLPNGTLVTEKRILWSNPIQGTKVLGFSGISGGSAATERVAKINFTAASFSPTAGVEYVIRVVYKDILTHPGQFTETYRVTATSTSATDLTNAFVLAINTMGVTPSEARVIATNDTNDLVLTGKVIPNNESNDEIDEYSQVDFVCGLTSDNFDATVVAYTTVATPGIGNPKLVRDKEKMARGYQGVTNTINFPVIKATMATDMTKWYDVIVIEHDTDYESGEMQYIQSAPITTEIYIPTGAAQTSTSPTAGIEATLISLNAWMATLPKAFANVSV
jgi:hypothetical protein